MKKTRLCPSCGRKKAQLYEIHRPDETLWKGCGTCLAGQYFEMERETEELRLTILEQRAVIGDLQAQIRKQSSRSAKSLLGLEDDE